MNFYTQEEHKLNNGKLVASTLQSIGGEGTVEDLGEKISYLTGASKEQVEPQLKQVLRQAIRDGFLIRNGKVYSFPEHKYEVDSNVDNERRPTRRIDRNRDAIASRSQKIRKVHFSDEPRERSRSPQSQTASQSESGSN